MISRVASSAPLFPEQPPPHALPVLAVGVGDTAVALEELVRKLKHRQHHSALGRVSAVPTPGGAPDELTGTDREASIRAFLVNEAALEYVGLLDLDMLMVGQHRTRCKAREHGDEPALRIK